MSLRVIHGGPTAPTQGIGLADYVWISPDGDLESKTRIIPVGVDANKEPVPVIDRWTAHTNHGPILLSPCHYLPDPLRPQPSFITLCEVRDKDDNCPVSNHRNTLRHLLGRDQTIWWGFRQEYELYESAVNVEAAPKEHFAVAERHLGACMDAGLMIHSADLATGNFKVGHRGMPATVDPDAPTALVVADHLWIARYLLTKVAREYGLEPSYANLQCAAFFSTERMRNLAPTGIDLADNIIRLGTALASDEDSSWRPDLRACVVAQQGGFECLEDQNPPGTMDPYQIAGRLLAAIRNTETLRLET